MSSKDKASGHLKAVFSGYFSEWALACEAAEKLRKISRTVQPFDSARWMARQRELLKIARLGKHPRPTCLPQLVSTCNAEFIVDLGGGSGWTSETLSMSITNEFKSYIVLEIPSACEQFSIDFLNNPKVAFYSSISEIPNLSTLRTDILYSHSVLQYFKDDELLSEIIYNLKPTFILLDDFKTAIGENFFTLQNYYGDFLPFRLMNLDSIQETCGNLGYELINISDYESPISASMNAKIEGTSYHSPKIGQTFSLLFKKSE